MEILRDRYEGWEWCKLQAEIKRLETQQKDGASIDAQYLEKLKDIRGKMVWDIRPI